MSPRTKTNNAHLLILLPQSLKTAAEQAAERQGISTAELVRKAIANATQKEQ